MVHFEGEDAAIAEAQLEVEREYKDEGGGGG